MIWPPCYCFVAFSQLFYQDPISPSPSRPSTSAQSHGFVVNDDDDDDDDDEVVFTSNVDTSRRTSGGTHTSNVDPNAPTPAPARRTETRFQNTPNESNMRRTAPSSAMSSATPQLVRTIDYTSRLRSPTYDFGTEAGLLDDD